MTGKERVLTALAGGKADVTPVAIDYMRLYLAERTERACVEAYREWLGREGRVQIDPDEDVQIRTTAFLEAYHCFQERHDWLQVRGVPVPNVLRRRELVLEGDEIFEVDNTTGARRQMLLSGQGAKAKQMHDNFERMRRASKELDQLDKVLTEHCARVQASRGDLRPVEAIVHELGEDYFVYTGASAPFWSIYGLIGFEAMMTALHDTPDLIFTVMERMLELILETAQAFKRAGGHGIRIEECLASADMISPAAYERFALPFEKRLFAQLRHMGLKTILYFCGNVMPRLPALRHLPIDALMVEESKKGFNIEIAEVRAAVGPDICLLGNIDSHSVVRKGTEVELAAEVARQIRVAGADGAFIVSLGSPLVLDTPPERVDLLIRHSRRYLPEN